MTTRIERIAEAIGHDSECAYHPDNGPIEWGDRMICNCNLEAKARAADRISMEEAAKICERHAKGACGGAGYYLAKKIRAAIGRPPDTDEEKRG